MKRNFTQTMCARRQSGIGLLSLTLITAVFIILPFGLIAFELMRYNLILQELRNVTDAAALAGSAAMASAPKHLDLADIHELAMETAAVTFQQNSVGSTQFSPANVTVNTNTISSQPSKRANEAVLNIALLDNEGNGQPKGSALVKRLRVQSLYTDRPAFAYFLHLQPLIVASAVADGGLPKLDLFFCFDVSGSMDDQTEVTLMKRFWNAKPRMVDYKVLATGEIYQLFRPPPTGTALNAFWPQNLSYGSYGGQDANGSPWIFSEGLHPSPNKMNRLRSGLPPSFPEPYPNPPFPGPSMTSPEQKRPPGNYDPQDPGNQKGNKVDPDAYGTGFTDLIVKIPSNANFSYPNLQVCLEASRGNLESTKVFDESKGGANIKTNPALVGITPKHGYYINYWTQVQLACQPISDAKAAALKFLDSVNTTADAHFGLDAFADTAGTSEIDYWKTTPMKIDRYYKEGGNDLYPLPLVHLDSHTSKYMDIANGFAGTGLGNIDGVASMHKLPLGPTGKTNIADVLNMAIQQLTDPQKSRRAAKKAIVLFTDGVPGEPHDISAATQQALNEAAKACQFGIPIYTIGLSQNADVCSLEDRLLGDGHNGSGQGIAYRSGNHAIYIPVRNRKDLIEAFQTVARSLVVLRPHQ